MNTLKTQHVWQSIQAQIQNTNIKCIKMFARYPDGAKGSFTSHMHVKINGKTLKLYDETYKSSILGEVYNKNFNVQPGTKAQLKKWIKANKPEGYDVQILNELFDFAQEHLSMKVQGKMYEIHLKAEKIKFVLNSRDDLEKLQTQDVYINELTEELSRLNMKSNLVFNITYSPPELNKKEELVLTPSKGKKIDLINFDKDLAHEDIANLASFFSHEKDLKYFLASINKNHKHIEEMQCY